MYQALFSFMDKMKLSESEYEQMFDDIQKMEFAALEEMHSEDNNV